MMTQEKSASNQKYSFIFVNYRSVERLARALGSLSLLPERDEIECIVVNNDPKETEKSKDLCRKYGAIYVQTERNIGFGAASNRGAAKASGEILGFLNPDTEWKSGAIAEIGDALRNGIGVVGVELITPDGQPEEWSFGQDPSLFGLFCDNLLGWRNKKGRKQEGMDVVDWVSGAALFLDRSFFELIGGFDERFFLYFEDADLCRRVRIAGRAIVRLTSIRLAHSGGASHTSRRGQKRAYFRSRDLYFSKYESRWKVLVLRVLQAAYSYW